MTTNEKKIIKYLFEVASGNCSITNKVLNKYNNDLDFQNVLIGIQSIHQLLELRKESISDLEKEIIELHRELRDRVKNNMQIINSLLSLQSNYVDHEETRTLIRYCQYRINSMSMIHELLYRTEDLAKIEYSQYIELLANSLTTSMKGHKHNITLKFDICPIVLNIDTAIPLGLLLNEIITNSLKYGIKDDCKGEIYITLKQYKYPDFILKIGDNGVGFKDNNDFRSSKTLGLLLIHKLALQLKGNIEKINKGKGTHFILSFKRID